MLPTTELSRLDVRFKDMVASGLNDLKVWYVPTGDPCTIEDLAHELNLILDAYENKRFVDISDKLR